MRRYNLNEEFFENLNEKSVYWLGFLYADGYVRMRRSGELKLKLKDTDSSHIEKFLKDLNCNVPMKFGRNGNSSYCLVSINSNKLVKSLIELGCCQNKTQKIRLPDITPDLMNHFIRGYFDGDGSISRVKNRPNSFSVSICSNKNFVEDIHNFFEFGTVIKFTNYSIWIAGKIEDVKFFRDFIYKNKETFLERKLIIFNSIDDEYKRDYSLTRNKKTYKVTNPEGQIFISDNLKKFCIENKLVYSTMSNLSRGVGKSNHGWKCELKNI